MKQDVKVMVIKDLMDNMRKLNIDNLKPEKKEEKNTKPKKAGLLIRLAKLEAK